METRKYDTVDATKSGQVAKELGLSVVEVIDLGDQHEIVLFGTESQHGKFREREGYAESESTLVPNY